jgi:nitronate monooxygenase
MDTMLTRLVSGRLARAIRSPLATQFEGREPLLAPFPMQGKLMAAISSAALRLHKHEYLTFWAGQSAGLLHHRDAAALLLDLVRQMDETKQQGIR